MDQQMFLDQVKDFDPDDCIDKEPVINIDITSIEEESKKESADMITNLSNLYNDEEFLKENPTFKKTIDTELESLRILLKMRKSDEETHDVLIKAIENNSNNASLYMALTKIQTAILAISKSIDEVLVRLKNTLKNYQLEIPFKDDEENSNIIEDIDNQSVHRGSRDFIQAMQNEEKDS